jgi:arabinofuranosyltransferase
MMVSALCFRVSGEWYFSVLVVAIVLTLTTGACLLTLAGSSRVLSLLGVLLFASSSAAIRYAVSGLENPLLFLLLVTYVMVSHEDGVRHVVLKCTFLASLIGLTRMDALLLVSPSLILLLAREGARPKRLVAAASAFIPFLGWELFSLVYYGSLIPNTAIAKLNIAVSRSELVLQGLSYFVDSLVHDPITLLTTVAAVGMLLRSHSRLRRAFAIGALLHLSYVLYIGGDFMTGRFFGPPFAFALASSLQAYATDVDRKLITAATAALGIYFVCWPHSPCTFRISRGPGPTLEQVIGPDGIADEQAFYYRSTGLLHMLVDYDVIKQRGLPIPPHTWAQDGVAFANSAAQAVTVKTIGFFGYFAGRKLVVDRWALSDAFLARLPECAGEPFRIGHCGRAIPDGYMESLLAGKSLMQDEKLSARFDHVQRVVSGPLFDPRRWRSIACLHLGSC